MENTKYTFQTNISFDRHFLSLWHYRVEEVRCVAKWKEGSTFYFLGLLNHSHVQENDYERRFRCFAYSRSYKGFRLAQSGEAKCNLPNSNEGDRTMKLKQGTTV